MERSSPKQPFFKYFWNFVLICFFRENQFHDMQHLEYQKVDLWSYFWHFCLLLIFCLPCSTSMLCSTMFCCQKSFQEIQELDRSFSQAFRQKLALFAYIFFPPNVLLKLCAQTIFHSCSPAIIRTKNLWPLSTGDCIFSSTIWSWSFREESLLVRYSHKQVPIFPEHSKNFSRVWTKILHCFILYRREK